MSQEFGTAELKLMHEAGMRGVALQHRRHEREQGRVPVERVRAMAERIARLGWHIEMLAHVNEFPDLDRLVSRLPVPVVFGHLGYVPTREGVTNPGFQALLRLMREGKAWTKLTAPYRISGTAITSRTSRPSLMRCSKQLPTAWYGAPIGPMGRRSGRYQCPTTATSLISSWIGCPTRLCGGISSSIIRPNSINSPSRRNNAKPLSDRGPIPPSR